jgi:ADP-ribose pyrophosphatase YjhB (NUDIX family)
MQRPRLVIYVTREHPLTGADELLVLDRNEALHVPAGRLEACENLQQSAVHRVREETGLTEIRVTRELGVDQGSRFVQAVPESTTADSWEQGELAVRWEPVRAGLPLWEPHAAFLHELVRRRVVAYVTRERKGRHELLVFDHKGMSEVPTQVPAGRIDADEQLKAGLRREVEEETGLAGIRIAAELADADEFERLFGVGAHRSWAFHAVVAAGGPERWEHSVTGTGMDAGFVFVCRWVPLDDCPLLWGKRDPLVDRLLRSMTEA